MRYRTSIITLAAAGTALALTACSSEPGPFETSEFADEIEDTLDDALADGETDGDIRCPIDDWEDIVESSVEELDDDVIAAGLRGGEDELAIEFEEGSYLDCSFYDEDDEVGVGLFFLEAPRDVDEYAEDFAGEDARVDIDVTNEYRGGQFRHVCADYPDDDDGFAYCQVEWSDDDVLIGLYVLGEDADRIDTEVLEEGFRPQLDVVMGQFTE